MNPPEEAVEVAKPMVITLLHGYPGSSEDWREVIGGLGEEYEVLAPDFLGFGSAPKPRDHRYSIHGQADRIEALWRSSGVTETVLVAHDYGATVAQELLARRTMSFTGVALLNGGVYPDLHRPTEGQKLLLGPDGPALAGMMDEAMFSAGVAVTFGVPARRKQLSALWQAMARNDGHLLAADLLHYVADRREHATRWTTAMESTDVPLLFIWGPEDPVSGTHMIERVAERIPDAGVELLPGVGHWPLLEDPEGVVRILRRWLEGLVQPARTD